MVLGSQFYKALEIDTTRKSHNSEGWLSEEFFLDWSDPKVIFFLRIHGY